VPLWPGSGEQVLETWQSVNSVGLDSRDMSSASEPSESEGATVSVTPQAAEEALALMEGEGMDTDVGGLRLFVQQGGCAGLSYGMRFDHEPDGEDTITEHHGLRVFVDPASMNYIDGSRLEYEGGLQGAGFHVENPNVVSECGCGESFRT
jgi:iron-sulfur cluster assembly protein